MVLNFWRHCRLSLALSAAILAIGVSGEFGVSGSGVAVRSAGLFDIAAGVLISSLYLLVHCSCSAFKIAYLSLADWWSDSFFLFFFRHLPTRLRLPGALKNIACSSRSRYLLAAREFGVKGLLCFFFVEDCGSEFETSLRRPSWDIVGYFYADTRGFRRLEWLFL